MNVIFIVITVIILFLGAVFRHYRHTITHLLLYVIHVCNRCVYNNNKSTVIYFRMKAVVKSKEYLREELCQLRAHLESLKSPVVFCHSDLAPSNIIYNAETGT